MTSRLCVNTLLSLLASLSQANRGICRGIPSCHSSPIVLVPHLLQASGFPSLPASIATSLLTAFTSCASSFASYLLFLQDSFHKNHDSICSVFKCPKQHFSFPDKALQGRCKRWDLWYLTAKGGGRTGQQSVWLWHRRRCLHPISNQQSTLVSVNDDHNLSLSLSKWLLYLTTEAADQKTVTWLTFATLLVITSEDLLVLFFSSSYHHPNITHTAFKSVLGTSTSFFISPREWLWCKRKTCIGKT